MSRSQLAGKMKSKADIYKILTKEGQLYLPPMDECPMLFIKDVLMGKKKVSWLEKFVSILKEPLGSKEPYGQEIVCTLYTLSARQLLTV